MRALIIEDEKPAAERLTNLLNGLDQRIEVMGILDSVKTSISWLNANKTPDVLFVDIHLADGNSFEIFNQVEVDAPIIFTTAYDQYALKAFDHLCVDYLLKPVEIEGLNRSLEKLSHWSSQESRKLLTQLASALNQPTSSKQSKDRFLVRGDGKLISIKSQQVAYFQAFDKMVMLVTHENRHFAIDQTLEELESQVDTSNFFRLNRSMIANAESITEIEPFTNGKILIKLNPAVNQPVVVSRDKAKVFKQWLGE